MSQVLNIDAWTTKLTLKNTKKEPNSYVFNNQTITIFFIRYNTRNYKAKMREKIKAPKELIPKAIWSISIQDTNFPWKFKKTKHKTHIHLKQKSIFTQNITYITPNYMFIYKCDQATFSCSKLQEIIKCVSVSYFSIFLN